MPKTSTALPLLHELQRMSDGELGSFDIAYVHLQCAVGLPSSVPLSVPDCLARLDSIAEGISGFTENLRPRYEGNRQQFTYSPEYFRMICLILYLEQKIGIYSDDKLNNPAPGRRGNPDFSDASDIFLHGILAGKGGNCSTLPLLYVSLGRRLGYPLKLVSTACHLFARWEDKTTRFNIECTPRGLNTPPDDYYHTWPRTVTQAEIDEANWLKSQWPCAELAGFLIQRAYCLQHNGRHVEGVNCCLAAARLYPENKLNMKSANSMMQYPVQKIPAHFPFNRKR